MIVDPLRSLWKISRSARRVEIVVHVEADHRRFPLHGENVIIIRKLLLVGKAVRISDSPRTRISRSMDCAVNHSRLFADILHDVDLAAAGPSCCSNVVAQHPERGPNPLAARNLDARLKTAVRL